MERSSLNIGYILVAVNKKKSKGENLFFFLSAFLCVAF